jgi:hypothetical protein
MGPLSGLWTVIRRLPCDEGFDSPSSRFDDNICSQRSEFHGEFIRLLHLLNSCNSLTPDFSPLDLVGNFL